MVPDTRSDPLARMATPPARGLVGPAEARSGVVDDFGLLHHVLVWFCGGVGSLAVAVMSMVETEAEVRTFCGGVSTGMFLAALLCSLTVLIVTLIHKSGNDSVNSESGTGKQAVR